MQDRAQRAAYTEQWGPDGEHIVIVDGEDVGRVWWADHDDERWIVDVTLVESAQGRGIGTAIFEVLIASAGSRRVRCTVDRTKEGWRRRLRQLGFVETAADDLNVYLQLAGG
jgi:GNAT superfamily N-acetyltransferase